MRGSNKRRLRSEITVKVSSDDDEDVGTAARTRPFSFDEIMLKRKNRKVLEYTNGVESEVGKISSDEATRYGSGRSALDKCHIHDKDTVHSDANIKTTDAWASFPRKEEKASKREADSVKSKNKDHGLEAKLVQKVEKYVHHKTVEKIRKDVHHRSNEKMEKVVRSRSIERREKDTHHRSGEKLEKGVHHRSGEKLEKGVHHRLGEKLEKHMHHRSSEKVEKDAHRQSNEKIEKDVTYRDSQRTERDTSRRSKQNPEKDLVYKSLTGDRGYDKSNVDEQSRKNSEYDYEKKHHRDHLTSKNRNIDRDATTEREYKRKDRNADDVQHVDKNAVKKHDSGKRLVSEVSARKEKLDSSNSRNEEARLKRRRSKSPDDNKDRGRRSASFSPKARKYSSSRGDEPHLDKDRSKHQTDEDRSKILNGSGLYHRHGGSSSGLGGYSPRKRKSDAAVRTPSPLRRSPEKRNAGWDRHPSGKTSTPTSSAPSALQILVQAKPSILVESAGVILANLNASNSLSSLPSSHLLAAKNASADTIQLTQATRPLRRLYVDNVPPSASEKDIMECFNNFLLSSGVNRIQGTKPCISCMIHKEKGQALVEFLTPEDASAALAFDRKSLFGSSLKIRRPKDFVEMANDFPERSKAGADAVSDIVKDSPHKIFVGGISDMLSSEMLLQIVRAFGPLKAFHFEIDENLREPCAFLEYVDQSVTLKACAALNGMKLGGKVLTVSQAFPDASFVETYGDLPSYEIPQHVKTLLGKPTEVLKIKNAVDPSAMKLLSESEVEETLEDVRQECTRFGSVKSINIVKTVDAVIPETQEATDEATSSPTSKETEKTPKTEFDAVPDVDYIDTLEMDSLRNVDEKTGVSVTESNRIPKEEWEDALVANSTTAMEHVVEEFEKSDRRGEPIKSEVEVETNYKHTTMSLVGDIVANKADISDATLVEETGKETATDIKLDFHENEVPEEVDTTNFELQEKEHLKNVPSTEVDAKELSKEDDVFEPGCIFVEFRRTEASCMAAHCLHGRLFDGRTVTVEYVPHDAYMAKFPK